MILFDNPPQCLYFYDMNKWDKQRQAYKEMKPYYYHLSSDGWKEGLLFHTVEQFAYGMILMGLLTLRYGVVIFDFVLMPNHIHILLKGSGEQCLQAFDYFRKKLSACLVKDGYPPLPDDYGFVLIPVESEEQMRVNILYLARNPYEKNMAVPGGYPWGTAYLHGSTLATFIRGRRVEHMKQRELEAWTCTRTPVPSSWEFHPQLGLLPGCFIDQSMFTRLFPTPKQYETHLIKDYESFVQLGKNLNESVVFTREEVQDMVQECITEYYPGNRIGTLTPEEKGRLSVALFNTYNLPASQLAEALSMPEYLVKQFLYAKDYGKQRR